MSIPPLVCSTPPPPDQCEDDKDPEDFDIQYNLSQDDDDENYDYGSFATYNHFQSSKSEAITKVIENVKKDDSPHVYNNDSEIDLGTNINSESKMRFDEEINIEDLDLKLNREPIEQADTLSKNISKESKSERQDTDPIEKVQIESELKDKTDVLNTSPLKIDEYIIETPGLDEVVIETPGLDKLVIDTPGLDTVEEPPTYIDEIITNVDDLQLSSEPGETAYDVENININREIFTEPERQPDTVKQVVNEDDDFGDFDDFKFASTAVKPATLTDNCDNPWDNNDTSNDEFGNFKANFDEDKSNLFSVPPKHSIEVEDNTVDNADDDFGDFDDFKSTAVEATVIQPYAIREECTVDQYVPVNLQSTDNEAQLLETINKVIYSVFLEDIPEPEEEFEGKLESVLGETWGHLLEIDVRQPYMVNWNNSLGQKTLLRALCIDSRNILFGPKWSYNMPKYAANLSTAPLQPQKQVAAPSMSQVEPVNLEKTVNKASGTWSDPFTPDGQDSCNPDSENESQVTETGPTDLDVFEASTSSKPDKIFSSTLNVQPLRQINLPDTHIFTPTDSETPRSTTIHYDSSLTEHHSQSVIETSKSKPNLKCLSEVTQTSSKPEDNDDYWEFQDFKGTSNAIASTSEKSDVTKTNTSVARGTQLLQPIKMEPIMPTLNWPDPGEVKETFDDFSDFVSNSTLEDQQLPVVPVQKSEIQSINETSKPECSNTPMSTKRVTNNTNEIFDDDFDTFQSALPSTSSLNFNFTSTSKTSTSTASTVSQAAPSTLPDFDYAFPKINNVKSETISLENTIRPKDTYVQNKLPYFPNNLEVNKTPIQTTSIPITSSNLLQPTHANTSTILQNQQKSAQILQPLSLESYSQINWPNPGIDLQDLSRFNPVETLNSLKTDLSANTQSKVASPAHSQKNAASNQGAEDDIWGDFVSSKPKPQSHPHLPKKQTTFADDDEWTDFVSSPSVKPQNGLNTISLNVHSNFNIQKSKSNKYTVKSNQLPLDIPTLNYITPKASSQKAYNDRHFQNL